MSTVINEKVQEWRRKAADGTITMDEMREAIEAIRKERVNASEKSATSRARKAKEKANENINSDDLLGELGI